MVIFDTSAWIHFFQVKPSFSLETEDYKKIAICPPIYQEVLQGVKDDLAFQRLKEKLNSLIFLDSTVPQERYSEAAKIYRQARKKGFTIRSGQDCLIAAIAIHYEVPIFHFDRDFESIAKFTSLQITPRRRPF